MINYENIPEELQRLNQWVCAKSDSKVPMQAKRNKAASSVNPSTWADFQTALNACRRHYDYIGFVFADNDYVGIDIDDGFDEDGLMSPLAADIIGACKSYTEKSRSGRGFHIIVKGELPFKGKNNLHGVEIYKSSRYFIMTGNTLLYRKIECNQEAINYVIGKFFADAQKESKTEHASDKIYRPVWEDPIDGDKIKLRPTYPKITNGSRNLCLTSLAGMLHNTGYTKSQIYEELMFANNSACEPPLDKYEVQAICNSITKYKR